MKDNRDRATGDLLKSADARRQAEFKERQRAAGFAQKTVWVRKADYDAGKLAAELGSTNASDCPPDRDRLSWMLGYCEELNRFQRALADHKAKEATK